MIFFAPPNRWMTALLPAIALILSLTSVSAAGRGPLPASKSLTADGQPVLSSSDRCPVCAMFPARYPRTAAAMTLKNGATFYFCSNGCLFRSWLRPKTYLNHPREAINRLVVRDYFSGRPIDARKATWVAGSNVIGPMGPAIIALDDAGQLAAFQKRHGGKTVFAFDQINDALWKQISRHKLPEP